MTNKIVILDDSVILYEHYISDDKWERTLAFPRGGLTYLLSNGTIKFYAYEDYFYRNCLISMQLPIYIVDEYMHIDGEYDNIKNLTEVLDRIFPTNDMDAELSKYLKIVDAELLYQPIGDYALKSDIPDISDLVTTEELVEALDDYYTKEESDARFQPKGDYLTSADTYVKNEIDDKLDDKLDASAYTPCDLSNYYTKQETSSKTQIDTALERKADSDKVYTKTESDGKYQPKGNYALKSELPNMSLYQKKLIAGENITISGNVISASGGGGEPVDAYTKAESDARYQPKGNYATESWVLNKNYITSASTVFNNYYTKTELNNKYYTKNEVNNIIANIQNQISALTEALNECCSGTPTPTVEYRWITLTGSSDYICVGTTKYEKQQKQQSTDGGITWTNVVPSEYQRGSVIETNSENCGYVPEGDMLIMTDATGGTYTLYCGYDTDYLGVHGMKDFTYYDGVSVTKLSGFLPKSTCQTIREVELGNCLETLIGQVFMDYSGLTTVTIHDTFKKLGSEGYGNFENCVALENINIPDSVYYIGGDTFKGCTNLKSVTIGSGVKEIYDYAFSGCTSLTSITINAITPPTITDKTFADSNNCIIYVPCESVSSYKTANVWSTYYADRIRGIQPCTDYLKFSGTTSGIGGTTKIVECNNSTTLTSGETKTMDKYTSFYFGDCIDTIGEHALLSNWATNITIPSNIRRLERGAFESSASAVTITLNEGLEYIGQDAFTYAPNVTTITIPNSVTEIGMQAFYGNRFRTVIIGSGVTRIHDEAFAQSRQYLTMESLTINAITPPVLDSTDLQTFNGSYPIYVPAESVNAYKNAWSQYSDRIHPISELNS